MLERVVARTRQARHLDDVIIATTNQPEDEAIISVAEVLGVPIFRGSESDVLDRYYHVATQHDVETVVRINADCPLIDPDVIDRVITAFREYKVDYASTSISRTYPLGIGAEVMTYPALRKAWRQAKESYERTHVTPYIYHNPERFKLLSVTLERGDYSHHRWTVDTQNDLDFVREVYARLSDEYASWTKVLALLEKERELIKINQHIEQKDLREG